MSHQLFRGGGRGVKETVGGIEGSEGVRKGVNKGGKRIREGSKEESEGEMKDRVRKASGG